MKSGSAESEVGRRMAVPCKCWFTVLLVACCGALGAGTWVWGAQDSGATEKGPWSLESLTEYLGFRFASETAQAAVEEFLLEVMWGRVLVQLLLVFEKTLILQFVPQDLSGWL